MYCLSVNLIQIQSYRAFSKMAVDHWCLSLSKVGNSHQTQRVNLSGQVVLFAEMIGVHVLVR